MFLSQDCISLATVRVFDVEMALINHILGPIAVRNSFPVFHLQHDRDLIGVNRAVARLALRIGVLAVR